MYFPAHSSSPDPPTRARLRVWDSIEKRFVFPNKRMGGAGDGGSGGMGEEETCASVWRGIRNENVPIGLRARKPVPDHLNKSG
ncbi:hypothetical protein C0Q70_17966 [Pomacea canaliculata]|uniref:Uncharacterized protein n=1 Tax=Pomacea canaliculata TaxID=400727 RepID=A0A2T7NLX6_POMCA|nr:hypothetical protein C0Q70_17966 [Pomacea canaliculata]